MKTEAEVWMRRRPYPTMPPTPHEERWEISPDEAQRILDSMVKNRPIKDYMVDRYAHDMLQGNWSEHSNTISIDPDGHLLDGQHRMKAVIKTGKTIPFSVKLDVPPETQFDIGLPRTPRDAIWMSGNLPQEYCSKNVISIANMVLERTIGSRKYRTLSNTDREKFLSIYGDECVVCSEITRVGHNGGCRLASVQAGAFAALLCGVPEETLREFFRIANSGYSSNENQYAAITLNKILERNKRYNGMTDRAMKQSATEQAIRDFARGVPRQQSYRKIIFPYSDKIAGQVRDLIAEGVK